MTICRFENLIVSGGDNGDYNGLQFKTSLEARWAAFFDLAGWTWHANPMAVDDWSPDFKVKFPCDHSECSGSHTLLIAVLPYEDIESFKSHPCLMYPYGGSEESDIGADAGAAFGTSPKVTYWEMSHGAGGGSDDLSSWVRNVETLWIRAGQLVE